MTDLAGKVALVTGGSRGIGAAIVRRLARDGAAVAFTYVAAADKAKVVAKQIDADGGRVLVIRADNADPGASVAAVEQTVRELGGLDILVNNAGVFIGGPVEEATVEQADRLWAVDVRAVFVASQAPNCGPTNISMTPTISNPPITTISPSAISRADTVTGRPRPAACTPGRGG